MLLMDRPKTKWSVLDKISSQHKQMELPSFFEVGCYDLHTVHQAFQPGAVWTKQSLDKVLHALWKLFKDSSASRDTYISVNCSVAPQFFFKTSFIEDVMVSDEAIEIWPYILNVILKVCFHLKNQKMINLIMHYSDVILEIKGSVRERHKRALVTLKNYKRAPLILSYSNVLSIFTLILVKQIFQKFKSLRAVPESWMQYQARITADIGYLL